MQCHRWKDFSFSGSRGYWGEKKVIKLVRSREAFCERSLHYFKPHQALGKSYEKNRIQGRRAMRAMRVWACCLQLRTGSLETPRDRMEALGCHQFTA